LTLLLTYPSTEPAVVMFTTNAPSKIAGHTR